MVTIYEGLINSK